MEKTPIDAQAKKGYTTFLLMTGFGNLPWEKLPPLYQAGWREVVRVLARADSGNHQPAPIDNDSRIAQTITGYQEKVDELELEVEVLRRDIQNLTETRDDYYATIKKMKQFRELKQELGL